LSKTFILVDFLERPDNQYALLYRLARTHSLAISIITHAELYASKGVWEHQEAQAELETVFAGLSILPLEQALSVKAGEIRARFHVDLFDAIIAATAIVNHRELVTLNTKHFKEITGLSLFAPKEMVS
jgi:predicted nucleic acid-binding protein